MSPAEVRGVLMDLLREFISFCEENRLQYYLAYGSLLGAVRSGDMIPWDDDIDVLMPRPDYDRFLELYPKHPKPDTILFAPGSDDYPTPFIKLGSALTLFEATDYFFPADYGVCIDIFPLDGAPRFGGKALFRVATDLRRVQYRRFPYMKSSPTGAPQSFFTTVKKGAWHLLKAPKGFPAWLDAQAREAHISTAARVLGWASRAQLANWSDKVISFQSLSSAPQAADMVGWHTFQEALIDRKHIAGYELVQFGDLRVRTFINPELLLEQWYGSDWRIPNPDYKGPHGRAFWREAPSGSVTTRKYQSNESRDSE